MSFNQVAVMGRLTADPETRYTTNNTPVCSFSLAVDRRFNREETDFFDVTAFGKTAELIAQHFRKGKQILVGGELRQERWQTRDGQNRSKVGIVADRFSFVGGRDDGGSTSPGYQTPARDPLGDDDLPPF